MNAQQTCIFDKHTDTTSDKHSWKEHTAIISDDQCQSIAEIEQ